MSSDVLRGFRFMVQVPRFTAPIGFMSISGLNGEMTPEEWKEITDPVTALKFPTEITFDNLVLSRGVDYDNNVSKWWASTILANQNVTDVDRQEVTITALDKGTAAGGARSRVWTVNRAWPIGLRMNDFNAGESGVLIQSLVLANEGIRLTDATA